MICPKCGQELDDSAQSCSNCGAPVSTLPPLPKQKSMLWYHLMIYVLLYITAFSHIFLAGIVFTDFFSKDPNVLSAYADFPGWKVLDLWVFAMYGFVGIYALYTRFRLAKFRENGPRALSLLYWAIIVTEIFYNIGIFLIFRRLGAVYQLEMLTGPVETVVSSLILLIGNHWYFRNRKDQFCH